MQPLISVIIPVYKAEDYLITCVDSVLAQTYQKLEIILVDDGSPDGCPRICDDYAARDSRIRVLHKENGGLSSARNAGIDMARGTYVAFLDADDAWSPLFLERLRQALEETGADIAVCQFHRFSGAFIPDVPERGKTVCLSQREAFGCLFDDRNVNMVVAANKLYRRPVFHTIRYPLGKLHEDEAVIHELIGAAGAVAWVEEAHHFYRATPGSITNAAFSLKRLDETWAKEQRIAWFEARGMQDLADRTKLVYLNNLMRLHRTVLCEVADKPAAKAARKDLYRRFCQLCGEGLLRQASFKMRLRCGLFRLFPDMYSKAEYARLKRKEIV